MQITISAHELKGVVEILVDQRFTQLVNEFTSVVNDSFKLLEDKLMNLQTIDQLIQKNQAEWQTKFAFLDRQILENDQTLKEHTNNIRLVYEEIHEVSKIDRQTTNDSIASFKKKYEGLLIKLTTEITKQFNEIRIDINRLEKVDQDPVIINQVAETIDEEKNQIEDIGDSGEIHKK